MTENPVSMRTTAQNDVFVEPARLTLLVLDLNILVRCGTHLRRSWSLSSGLASSHTLVGRSRMVRRPGCAPRQFGNREDAARASEIESQQVEASDASPSDSQQRCGVIAQLR